MSAMIERIADVLQAEVALERTAAMALARRAVGAIREPDRVVVKAMCRSLYPECRPSRAQIGASEKQRIRWRAAIDRIVCGPETTA